MIWPPNRKGKSELKTDIIFISASTTWSSHQKNQFLQIMKERLWWPLYRRVKRLWNLKFYLYCTVQVNIYFCFYPTMGRSLLPMFPKFVKLWLSWPYHHSDRAKAEVKMYGIEEICLECIYIHSSQISSICAMLQMILWAFAENYISCLNVHIYVWYFCHFATDLDLLFK